jgi:hypothetical protein
MTSAQGVPKVVFPTVFGPAAQLGAVEGLEATADASVGTHTSRTSAAAKIFRGRIVFFSTPGNAFDAVGTLEPL